MLSDLRDLAKSRGWARLNSIAEAQVKTRTANALAAGHSDEKEFQKGEIAGINLFMKLPEMAIASLEEQIKESEERNEAETDDSE